MGTVVSPLRDYSGRTYIGGGYHLDFTDGVAEYDGDLPNGVLAYLVQAGYGVDGPPAPAAVEIPADAPVEVDSRDLDQPEQFGSTLRDAAVDPDDEDFLVPIGAGEHDPHGPDVIAPGLHAAEDTRPVKGRRVGTANQQDAEETAHARRTPRSR